MADRKRYTFTEQQESKGGRFAIRMAVASLALFVLAVLISFLKGGKGGALTGSLGFIAMMFSVFGFYMGMKSFGEPDVLPTFSIIGSIGCGVIMVGWLTLFLMGMG